MLRIHLTDADLARIRIARRPHAMWDTVLGLQLLQTDDGGAAFDGWRRWARRRLQQTTTGSDAARLVSALVPSRGYFPDFLTPSAEADGLRGGVEAIVRTPTDRARRELTLLEESVAAPAKKTVHRALRDTTSSLRAVGAALVNLHELTMAPYTEKVRALVEADRAVRGRALLDEGVEGLLATFLPFARWDPPILRVAYPVDQDLVPAGRGLVLTPSAFCWRYPVSLLDESLPPVLVYPLVHGDDGGPFAASPDSAMSLRSETAPGVPSADAVGTMMGRTRASVLRAAGGATTSEIARRAGVSVASASQHATVLRDAGLLVSRRSGSSVLHSRTPLGDALAGT